MTRSDVDHGRTPRFVAGLVMAVLPAIVMLTTDVVIAAPITLLIVGVVLIATSRREHMGT